MKTLKILFTVLALSMVTACTDFVPPREQPDHSHEQDLLKRRLTGEWVVSGEKDSYIYAFTGGDTIYTKTRDGDMIDLWPYQIITGDSIRIVRSYWTTDNRVIFYSNDSIRIKDFIPSVLAVYPPIFGDAVLIRFIATPPAEEKPVLTVADFDVPAGCIMNCANMQHDSVYVINSEEEWANIFTCGDRPEIDFSTKTLLVAFGGVTNGISNISKELLFENNTWSLTVDITLNMTTVAPRWHVVLITDKINAQRVILNLNKHFGDGTPACLWEQVTPTVPSNEQKSRLDDVFSDSNELFGNIQSDTLFVISSQEDMLKLQPAEYHDIWIDWNNYSVIGGKIVRPHGPNEIISQQLSICLDTSFYEYAVEVKENTPHYDAEEHLYFWAIYSKKMNPEEVSFIVKIVE